MSWELVYLETRSVPDLLYVIKAGVVENLERL